jgi:excisionase family DNA binding protein
MDTQELSDAYLTIEEVAARYRTTVATIRYWRHRGHGPRGVRLGTRVLFPADEVRRFDAELAARADASATG